MSQMARWGLGLAIVFGVWVAAACHRMADTNRPKLDTVKRSGPPEYAATVVRTIESGSTQQIEQTRVDVSSGLIREEWTEQGERRALILRPDLGKSYLLWIDKKEYTESSLGYSETEMQQPESTIASKAAGASPAQKVPDVPRKKRTANPPDSTSDGDSGDCCIDPDEVAPGVAREVDDLPNQTIDGHDCRARQETRHLSDGRSETIVTYSAIDLNGLAIRIEVESGSGATGSRVVTERRDVTLKVAPSEFVVPEGFKARRPKP